jgi:hypothetical protein
VQWNAEFLLNDIDAALFQQFVQRAQAAMRLHVLD